MATVKENVMSFVWNEPNTDNWWIGRTNGCATELVYVAGLCSLLIEWKDPRETVYDLQQLLLDWVLLTLMPERVRHKRAKG